MLPEGAGIAAGPRRFSHFGHVGGAGGVGGAPHARTQSASDLAHGGLGPDSLPGSSQGEDELNSSEEDEGGPLGSLAARRRRRGAPMVGGAAAQCGQRRVIKCSNRGAGGGASSAGENSDLEPPNSKEVMDETRNELTAG